MNVSSATIVEAFAFLADYGFHVEREDSWRGSYAVFKRGPIALVVDFDTIAFSSWLDLYNVAGENVAKVEMTQALKHAPGAPAAPRILLDTPPDYDKGLEEFAFAVKTHLIPSLRDEQVFRQLHGLVDTTK